MGAMKKALWRCSAALALIFALVAAPFARAAEPGKLLVWINGDKGYNGLQKVGDAFAQKSGVQVTVEHPEDAPAKFQQAAAAGKGPDVWCWPHDRIGEWIDGGLIVPVTPSKAIHDGIDKKAWEAFTVGGKLWGYPLSIEAIGLIYNKKLSPTPPKTFDDVVKLDKKLSAQGKKAILWDYNNTYFTWPLLAANGGFVFARDAKGDLDPTKVGVNNAGALQGAALLAKLVETGVMPKGANYSAMEAGFGKGEIAMMINGPWAWDNAKKAGIDFGVSTIPAVGSKPGKPFIGVLGCMITNPSPNKDIAKEFLEGYVLKIDGLKAINADKALGVPANKAFYKELAADANIKATMANAQLGEPMPNIPAMGKFWASMASALENMTNGRQTPKEALNGAAARMTGAEEKKDEKKE
jgi:maltose/maltodextrin transport system substrate-binding protein